MSNTTKITVSSEQYPQGKMIWEVELASLPPEAKALEAQLQFLYNNAAYDLTAAVAAKLGRMMSDLVVDIIDTVGDVQSNQDAIGQTEREIALYLAKVTDL